MRRANSAVGVLFFFITLTGPLLGQSRTWTFASDKLGSSPAGFSFARTGKGEEGKWEVRADPSAPSLPNVLAQVSNDPTDYRFPVALAEGTSYTDLALSVRFKTVSGKLDQGAGLVFRAKDKENYYVVRANALEDNFRLYHVVSGRRVQFAGANLRVTPQAWHEIKVEARGNEFKCFYEGQLRISAKDDTLKGAGKIGLWTKADSVIYFDDLAVEERSAAKSSGVPQNIWAQKLVDSLAARHPELVRIGLHVTPPEGADNIIVASNLTAKIGKKSDPEDLQAMRTGKPVVVKEEGNFDVTLPLKDASGKLIGALGLTFKPADDEKESSAVERARKIARGLEKQIPSKAKLFESAG